MTRFACILALSLALQVAAADPPKPSTETTAEKLRKALDATKELEIDAVGLTKAVEQLSAQTSVPFTVDAGLFPTLLPGGIAPGGVNDLIVIKLRGTYKLGEALNRALAPYSLTPVIVGERVYITAFDRAVTLQTRQRVSVALDATPLNKALQQLARETGANIIIDPQLKKEAETAVTIKLSDTPLEVAVTILASSAGMRAIRLDNVVFVTSTQKAAQLREDAPHLDTPKPLYQPYGLGIVGAIGLQNFNPGGWPNVLGAFGNLGGQFGVMGGGPVPPMGMMGLNGGAGALGMIGTPPPPREKVRPMIDPATGVPMIDPNIRRP